MHSPACTAFPKATDFHISFTLWILQTTTHTSLFWLIKVRTYSAISDWGNLSSGLKLQFKTFSEHKNTAIFYLTPFPAIYANIYIAPWVVFFFLILLQPGTGNYHRGISGMKRYNLINVLDQNCSDKVQCNKYRWKHHVNHQNTFPYRHQGLDWLMGSISPAGFDKALRKEIISFSEP